MQNMSTIVLHNWSISATLYRAARNEKLLHTIDQHWYWCCGKLFKSVVEVVQIQRANQQASKEGRDWEMIKGMPNMIASAKYNNYRFWEWRNARLELEDMIDDQHGSSSREKIGHGSICNQILACESFESVRKWDRTGFTEQRKRCTVHEQRLGSTA